jgi:CheY-like chemotaxis protein
MNVTRLLPSPVSPFMSAATKTNTPGTILIVDDNVLGLVARRSFLAELGYTIEISTKPEDALVMCRQRNFDLIVTDFKMPQMNGIEFISHLRQAGIQAPVILLSGFTDTLGLSAENTGADAVIQKSSNEVQHLIGSVNRLLKKSPKKPAGTQGSASKASPAKKRTAE